MFAIWKNWLFRRLSSVLLVRQGIPSLLVFLIVEMLVVVSSDMGLFGGIWGREDCIRQLEGSRIYFLLAGLQLFKETE